ncbi:FAD-dependent oxidoreductase [Actinomadura barringtoniae]|uniref:FAD-dependent oxidoreductase n=1 Tax=Actinomadura barringtoniae TaxID=1427535 RepID=A0A939PJC4_9ACTN|nr:FAD-dependent oxidoreductase [Actinomadura barringtoniae]MBO2449626.1 FAD-dependent oxidoreductase [Actinomadura barringtoniae]
MNTHRIVVLGAGYTGMMATARLAHRTRRMDVRITLVNPSPRFTERLRMHQIASGQELADHRIEDLLAGTGVTFVQGFASAIDPDTREVTVGDRVLPYDTLVYALGSATDTSKVPGADDHAFTLNGIGNAARFADRLAEVAAAGGTVTVSGGGLTGIEAAAEIAESHPGLNVTLISLTEPAAMMGAKARAYLLRSLDRLGVTLKTGERITKVLPDAIEMEGGELVPSDASLWTAGVKVSPLAAGAGLAVDGRGLVVVDATLRSVSHPDVFAIGDAAAVRLGWGEVHGTCQSGMPTAVHVADAIVRRLRGRKDRPFRFGYFHQPVSLGRKDGVIQFTHADDTPGRFHITGRWAVMYKEMVSGSPVKFFRLSKWVNVSATITKGGRATRRPVM